MTFSDYMENWLYGDEGYYATYKVIGKSGDFYTAVSTSKFFGGTIAKHIISLIEEGFLPEDTTICEIGAHHGYFLADMIEFIYTLRPDLLQSLKFVIIERFEALQEQQRWTDWTSPWFPTQLHRPYNTPHPVLLPVHSQRIGHIPGSG